MGSEKIHIERNSVQETLIVPLYGRKLCAEKFPELYTDQSARLLCEKLDYDFGKQEKMKNSFFYEFGALEAAMRQIDMMWEIRRYLALNPNASVVNLGCGLDQTGRVCDNGSCRIINIDLPDIISVRERLIGAGERERNISSDLKDHRWMDEIDDSGGAIFFAAGVFHYFKSEDVKKLAMELAEKFPGAALVFDSVGKLGLKLMMSKILKNMGIDDVSGFFHVDSPSRLNWSDRIELSRRGYMLGYNDMKSPGIGAMHRFLAKIGDGILRMAIYRMDFKF